ncbi:MAG: hypothetical protein HYU36_21445 [Planctomycetes bacterium]|nr:hypothetical protein [Planctomycetota bacterium]
MKTWMYRHDEVLTQRPYGIDVDEEGWLWEGCGYNRLTAHHLRTAELRQIAVPEMGNRPVYQVFAWEGKLVLTVGEAPFYLIYDTARGRCRFQEVSGERPIVWYGTKTPNGKVLLYERGSSRVLVLDGPEARPRTVACPYAGQLAAGKALSDGLIYSCLADPARVIRYDPAAERFVDETAIPWPEANPSGLHDHAGTLYINDSAGGRIFVMETASRRWHDPIPTPDHGKIYGFMGGTFSYEGKAYICLSTYRHASRLDPKTGKIIVPEGPLSVDGRPHRFLERYLVFDPSSRSFDYLVAPEQPDGVPLLCYNWTDGKRFAITGMVLPFEEPGVAGEQYGHWLVLQNVRAEDEPRYRFYDMNFDRASHLARCRRGYRQVRSLYIPEPKWSPPITNLCGPATLYTQGRNEELNRRAEKTDSDAYFRHLVEMVTRGCESDAERVKRIGGFIKRSVFYNPIQESGTHHPVGILESHDVKCGQGVILTLALLKAAGIPGRSVSLHHHVVAEATYDGGDHIVDALFFGSHQPQRDGRVLSVAELKANPYEADAYPQECLAYDPDLVESEDGFWVEGYVFGLWGSQPYYSYYLGAEKDLPPTLPLALPAQRLQGRRVRLNWARSLKMGGGAVQYEVRVFSHRACKQPIHASMRKGTSLVFEVPEMNRMYFVEVRAVDGHRKKNPATWYPATRMNFVLVPEEQYGWYGVL